MTTETIKGFKDFTGEEAEKRSEVRKILVETFEKYGFSPAETPVIESEELVRGENKEDEAVSDVYTLKDKGNRKLALRYEFTFQLKRLAKNKKLPFKRYQIGEVFRDEPTTSGKERFRQFTQCDVDVVGSSVKDEAEILALVKEVFDKLGIKFEIYFNNRKLLNEILDQYRIEDKTKPYVLREIDKLDKLAESEVRNNLKTMKAENVLKALNVKESSFKIFKSYEEILELKKYAKMFGVNIKFLPTLARGLSYYNGSVFELKVKGVNESIGAGGSYEVNGIQSTGISFGLDRLASLTKVKSDKEKILVISIEQNKKAISIAQKLRKQGKSVEIFYNKVSKALDYANSKGISKVIFVGRDEVKKGKFKIRDMKSGREKLKKEKELLKSV